MRINAFHYTKRTTPKPCVIISIDAEKRFTSATFIPNENSQQTKDINEISQPDICIYKKYLANIMLMVKRLDAFP